jgi:hypothetical protein
MESVDNFLYGRVDKGDTPLSATGGVQRSVLGNALVPQERTNALPLIAE